MAKDKDTIDLGKLLRKVFSKKKLFYKVWPITAILSYLLVICVPRYYSTTTKLAPEIDNSMGTGTLGSIASSFGIDFGDFQTSDAISPLLYPDLMDDNGFVANLFDTHVTSADGEIDTDYYNYLRKFQKKAWWSKVQEWLFGWLKSKPKSGASNSSDFSPYHLSKVDDGIVNKIRANIMISVDKKTGVITITTKAQDPVICKTLADTTQVLLQQYITNYRTKKARVDVEHYEQLANEARKEYDKARIAFVTYSDANQNAVLQSVVSKVSDLENDMQLKYNNYTAYNTQLQASLAKVQERTPAFTLLKGADVPIRPAGPKRMMFVIGMLFLATLVTTFIIVKKDIKEALLQSDELPESPAESGKTGDSTNA